MLSRVAYIVSVLVLCYASFFFYPKWEQTQTEATISWDVSGYYWYLPATFIYKDIKHIAFKDSILNKYQPTNTELQQAMPIDNGNYVMKYSSGMAVMYLPFFTAAHMLAGLLGYPKDGFSLPYQFGIQFGGLLISLIGLWYLRKLLLIYYEDRVVAVTIVLLALGSNYLNYAAIDCGMSHTWLFTIYVLLLLNTHHFYQAFKLKYAVRVGLLVGLATLTRPTEIISCLIPLLWGMEGVSISALRKQGKVIGAQFKSLIIAVVAAACVISIQLIYWKYVSGHWLVYSYGEQGFSWFHPHAILYSFNYRTGWLTYCPMMLLALVGFLPFIKYGKNKIAIIVFFFVSYYAVSAWDIWWYGGRAMVQYYAALSFPLAALIHWVANRKIMRIVFATIACVFLYFNLWLVVQYHRGGLYDVETNSKEYFWRVVGRWSAPERTLSLRDAPDLFEGTPKNLKLIYENNFDTCMGPQYVPGSTGAGKEFLLNKSVSQTPYYRMPYTNKEADWLRAQVTFRCGSKEWDIWKMPKMSLRIDNNGVYVRENIIRVGRFLRDGATTEVTIDLKLPRQDYTTVTFVIWNNGSEKEITADNIRIWEFNE